MKLNTWKHGVSAFGFAAIAVSGSAVASTIDIVSRSSTLYVYEFSDENWPTIIENTDSRSYTGVGIYDESISGPHFGEQAGQHSEITDNAIHYKDLVGLKSTCCGGLAAQAESVFSVTIDVPVTTQFAMDWSMIGTYLSGPGGKPRIIVTGPGGTAFDFTFDYQHATYGPSGPVGYWSTCDASEGLCPYSPSGSLTGTIAAGRYTVSVTTSLDSHADFDWDNNHYGTSVTTFNMVLTPTVPVPGAVWLMGSALVGLAGSARARRKTAR